MTNEKSIVRIDLATGQRETIYGLRLSHEALFPGPPLLPADGRAYAYAYGTVTSDLYVLEGPDTLSSSSCLVISPFTCPA